MNKSTDMQSPCGTPVVVTMSYPVSFPIFTLINISKSSSKKVRNIVKSFTMLIVSKALLICNIRGYMVKFCDVIAISANSFIGTPSRLICCLGLYCRALPGILLIIIIARIFLRSYRMIIGLKLEGGPCFCSFDEDLFDYFC